MMVRRRQLPPTLRQTEIVAPGIWAGAVPLHLADALLRCVHAVRPECM
jgi:hypothetical protein